MVTCVCLRGFAALKTGRITTGQYQPPQVGIAWLLKHADNRLLIQKTDSVQHLRENMEASHIKLMEEGFEELVKSLRDKVRCEEQCPTKRLSPN